MHYLAHIIDLPWASNFLLSITSSPLCLVDKVFFEEPLYTLTFEVFSLEEQCIVRTENAYQDT